MGGDRRSSDFQTVGNNYITIEEDKIKPTEKTTPILLKDKIWNLPPDIINLNIYVIKKHLQYVREENIGISKIITEECTKKVTPYI